MLQLGAPSSLARAGKTWRWALTSGAHPAPEHRDTAAAVDLLVTGHDDGSVTMWDVGMDVPRRVAVAAPRGECRKVVSAIAVDFEAGLMAVGHFGGEVRDDALHRC